jgi:hypothetical protein
MARTSWAVAPTVGGVIARGLPAGCKNGCRPLCCPMTRSSWSWRATRGAAIRPRDRCLRTVHAPASGDDAIVEAVMAQVEVGDGRGVTVITADRALRDRVEAAGARSVSPSWLLDQL